MRHVEFFGLSREIWATMHIPSEFAMNRERKNKLRRTAKREVFESKNMANKVFFGEKWP